MTTCTLTTNAIARLQAVRDEIAGLKNPADFSMNWWYHFDGAPSCIGARMLAQAGFPKPATVADCVAQFADLLELPISKASLLATFYCWFLLYPPPANAAPYSAEWYRHAAVVLLDKIIAEGTTWWCDDDWAERLPAVPIQDAAVIAQGS